MKILSVQDTDWIKRGPHQQHHLLERMAMRGHEVRIIDFDYLWHEEKDIKRLKGKEIFENAPTHVISDADITLVRPGVLRVPLLDKISIFFTNKREIKRELKKFQPDVVMGLSILNPYLAMNQCEKLDIPFVSYLLDHSHKLIENKPLEYIAKYFEKKVRKGADEIFVINQGLKDYCLDMGVNESKIDVIPAGVDLDKYDPAIEAPDLKEEYGISENDTILFFMGWIYEFSGMKEVARSLAENENENLKVMIVGEGDLYEYLEKFRDENGLKERLILTGKVPFEEIPRYLSIADICMLPAYKNDIMEDIVPIKMYEYMAMGKPVIATELPGIKKEFGEDSGIVYISKSEECVEKAEELIEDGRVSVEGRRAREYAKKQGWEKITDEFEKKLFNISKNK